MKDEVLGGIKNALERGISLEKAAQSFINAGYSAQDVQEAVQALGGVSAQVAQLPLTLPQQPISVKPTPSPQVPSQVVPSTTTTPATSETKSSTWRYVLIGLSIVIVILIASLIGVIAFSEQILEWLKPTG